MSSRIPKNWLVWIAAGMIAVCSCADKAQELSTYWEGHDFSSLDGFDNIKDAEQKFDGYLDILCAVPHKDAVQNLRVFLDSAKRNEVAYMVWAGWFASAFHAPNSPYRSDELFKDWLIKVEEDKVLENGYMIEELRQIRDVMDFNKEGDVLQELNLTNDAGEEFCLSEVIDGKTLVLFVDANCPSCLEALTENIKEYGKKKIKLVAVLANGGKYHVKNITEQLPEEVLSKWNLVWCRDRELEKGKKYDLTQLSFRMLVDADGKIIKAYY